MSKPDLIPSRGAVAEPIYLTVERELTGRDLDRLSEAPAVTVPILQKLRSTHHKMAILIAQGKPLNEVAILVGCTVQRLVQLQVDPTFTELVRVYQDQVISAMLTDAGRLADKIVDVGEMAVDELHERMEDPQRRKNLPIGEVRKIAEFAMDRTVAPPKAAPNLPVVPAAITINFGTPMKAIPEGGHKTVAEEAKVIDGKVTFNDNFVD